MEVTELYRRNLLERRNRDQRNRPDGEDEYRVCILRKGSQNFDYSCSHISKTGRNLDFAESPAHRNRTGSRCPHAHALLAE